MVISRETTQNRQDIGEKKIEERNVATALKENGMHPFSLKCRLKLHLAVTRRWRLTPLLLYASRCIGHLRSYVDKAFS